MSEIQRYGTLTCDCLRGSPEPQSNGDWVTHADHARIVSELEDAMRKELKTARELLREYREFHYGVRVPSGWRMMCIHEDNRCDLCKRTDAFESSATSAG
jgi:hypothetical protein